MSIDDATPEQWDAAYRAAVEAGAQDKHAERLAEALKPRAPESYQIGGDHYQSKSIQPIDYIRANNLDYFEGNAIKYITRHRDKNGSEDIRKAIHYLKMILNDEYKEEL